MMKSKTSPPPPESTLESTHDAAKTVLAAGGLLAAFGVASCCALPVALSLLGISAASLVGIGYLAAQYQRELFIGAVICLAAAAYVMWRQRRARLCSPGTACARPTVDWGSKIALLLAVALLGLTFWIEPPI
ncbi:MAG: mercuric reductase [Rhodospirillales bacterium]|nr:mercuric reductase [Rhodospirillales bacterium]